MWAWRGAVWMASLLGCIILAGCGGSSNIKTVPVAGKVTFGGKPFTKGGSLAFLPDKKKGNNSPHSANAEIRESGDYALKTKDVDGAPPGWYKVVVVSRAAGDPKDPYSVGKSYLNSAFESEDTTPLVVEVKEGQDAAAYEIKVQ